MNELVVSEDELFKQAYAVTRRAHFLEYGEERHDPSSSAARRFTF